MISIRKRLDFCLPGFEILAANVAASFQVFSDMDSLSVDVSCPICKSRI